MHNRTLAMAVLLTISSGFDANLGYAEDKAPTFNLEEMVITATRTMKEIQEVPSSISVVTAENIQEKNINSITEALQTLPGVYKSRAAQGGISIRGFDSTDILVLVDGQQMNSTYNNSMDWEMIPIENIERIEVARGAGSSLYGGRAVGAVISIKTKDRQKDLDVNVTYNYGSNNTQKKALYFNAKASEKLSVGAGYEKRSSDGFRGYYYTGSSKTGSSSTIAGKDIPQLSDGKYILGGRGEKKWDNENYSANLKYDFDRDKSLKYTYLHNTSEYRYKNPFTNVYDIAGNPIYNGNVGIGGGKIVSLSAGTFLGYDGKKESDVHILNFTDNANDIIATLSFTDMTSNGYSSPSKATGIEWSGSGVDSSYPGKTYNFDIQKAWENIGKHNILVGANYKQESFDQDRNYLLAWRNHDSVDTSKGNSGLYEQHGGKAKNFALFVQDEYKISKPTTMYVGLRYDRFTKTDGYSKYYDDTTGTIKRGLNYDEVSYNEISPKLAFDYRANDTTNYYISYGHSFNPPPLYQVYRDGGGEMGSVVANPDLDPEKSDTFEIGVKKQITKNTDFNVSLYHAKTKDKIVYVSHYSPGTSDVAYKQYENYGEEKRKGVELEINHKFDKKLSSYINYAWQNGKVKSTKVDGTNLKDSSSADYGIPKHLLHFGVQYKYQKVNALLEAEYVSARQAPDSVTGEYNSEDAFFVVNTSINYQISKNATVQFTIENLLDKEFYCSEATSGRTYSAGVRYSF